MPVAELGEIVDVSPAPIESTPTPVAAETSTVSAGSSSTPTSNTPASAPVTAVVSAGAAPAEATAEEWRQHIAKTYGLDATNFASPTQAIDYGIQAYITAEQNRERLQSDYQQRLAAYEQQLAVYQNLAPRQAEPTPKAETPQPGQWTPPEYDPSWGRLLQMNPQTGIYQAIDPDSIDPSIVAKANARADWERKWQSEFQQNPYEFVAKGLEPKFKEYEESVFNRVIEHFGQIQKQQELDKVVDTTVQSNSEWLYQKDAVGGIGRDAYGQPLLTEKGSRYVEAVKTLLKSGVIDPAVQNQLALQIIGHSDQPVATPASRIDEYVGKPAARNLAEALHTSNRNGSNQPVVAGAIGETATPGSFLAMAAGQMREQGIPLTSGTVTPI